MNSHEIGVVKKEAAIEVAEKFYSAIEQIRIVEEVGCSEQEIRVMRNYSKSFKAIIENEKLELEKLKSIVHAIRGCALKPSDVKGIVIEYLKENGFDGLFEPGECACEIEDLAPHCGSDSFLKCQPGYKTNEAPDDNSEFAFMMGSEKPTKEDIEA